MKAAPLRVAMVLASPFPANHGTPAAVRELALDLQEREHQVHIVTYPFGEGELPAGLKISRAPDIGLSKRIVVGPTWQKPILDLLLVFTLVRLIFREKIDIIHAHNYEAALVGGAARLLTGRPLVYNAVNTMSDELPSYGFIRPQALARWVARMLDYWVPRTANRIIAISDELVTELKASKIKSERIEMIPLGLDPTPFRAERDPAFRSRRGIAAGRLVMYTGVVDRFQRVDYLLKAMKMVIDEVDDARLALVVNVARDEDVEHCREMARELGIADRLEIFPDTPFKDVPHFLGEAEVAVVPRPDCPGFPVKLLNYMAAGKPIVAFEGSAKGLRHKQEGIVVQDHDWRAMGRGIIDLMNQPQFAAELGANAKRRVESDFAWPAVTDRTVALYNDVLDEAGRSPLPDASH